MIRSAVKNDVDSVYRIYKQHTLDISKIDDSEYLNSVQKNGFYLDLSSKQDIANRLEKSEMYMVSENNDDVDGFIDVNKEIYFPREATNAHWMNSDIKINYYDGLMSITLHLIAVEKSKCGNGIASALYQNAENRLRKKGYEYIFSIISSGPVLNCASLLFHTKNGFKRACVTAPLPLFGFDNYESILLYKDLRK